jgi:hypothetical protein
LAESLTSDEVRLLRRRLVALRRAACALDVRATALGEHPEHAALLDHALRVGGRQHRQDRIGVAQHVGAAHAARQLGVGLARLLVELALPLDQLGVLGVRLLDAGLEHLAGVQQLVQVLLHLLARRGRLLEPALVLRLAAACVAAGLGCVGARHTSGQYERDGRHHHGEDRQGECAQQGCAPWRCAHRARC